MFDGFEVIQFAWCGETVGVDRDTHRDLHIDASVVAMGFHGLGNQQKGDAQQAETAERSQGWIGVRPDHFTSRELLFGVIVHRCCVRAPSMAI